MVDFSSCSTYARHKKFLTQIRLSLHIVASLNIPMPFLCISWHCPSLPLHIGAAHHLARLRLTFSFHSVPMQCLSHASRLFTFSLPLRASICTAFPLRTRASPRGSMPLHRLTLLCIATAFHRKATPRSAIAAPGHAIHCASASLYLTQLCLCVATRFSTNPLHTHTEQGCALAEGSYSSLFLCFTMCFHATPLRFKSVQSHC